MKYVPRNGVLRKYHGRYTFEECFEIAKQYKTRGQFQRFSCAAYNASFRNGWLDSYDWMPKPNDRYYGKRTTEKYTYDECYKKAKECSCRSEFQRVYQSYYIAARKAGWLDSYDWMAKPFKHAYEDCYNKAKECTTTREFATKYKNVYQAAQRNNWLKDYTWLVRLPKRKKKDEIIED